MKPQIRSPALERGILLALGGVTILGLLALVLTNRHVDRGLAGPLRLLMALGAAAYGGLLPGATLNVGFNRNGLAIRSAGAAAFFVLVWLGGPGLLDRTLTPTAPQPSATAQP